MTGSRRKRLAPFGLRFLIGVALSALIASGSSFAAEFHATAEVAVLYDAPSARARPLFVLGRDVPLESVVNVEGWVKVRDASGTVAWVEKKALGDKRMLVVRAPVAEVLASPAENAPLVFKAEQNVLLELADAAPAATTPGWAKVRHRDGQTGFVRISQVWGL